eukprot:TRINITY_DN64278_c0_g1_i1.p1 TRINITY_DN64278_c0_g1~~TRINITY_DN64278_c0_g1_i1.p1  ORF type:complete len:382 (+),score=24.37 TRINITY_DN64278_c0_g1_i1:129-1148(+)
MEKRLREEKVKLTLWSSARAHDLIWAIQYFAEASPRPDEAMTARLLSFAELLHQRGLDWHYEWFASDNFSRTAVTKDFLSMWTHGVNNAQAVKHGAVWSRQSGNATQGFQQSSKAWDMLMQYHGQPSGTFAADEHLAGTMPSRGSELCIVVESMWSLALTAQLAPDDIAATKALDALEKLAYNALPGGISDDLWSHPYLQFANSFEALANTADHIWASDRPDSAMYGLAPNYECCTSNFHQGWPKFTGSLYFEDVASNAIISAVLAPSRARFGLGGGAEIELRTDYPFGTNATYAVRTSKAFDLRVRLPKFLRGGIALKTLRLQIKGQLSEPRDTRFFG